MQFHPAAEFFPLLEGNEFEQLQEDVRVNGLLEPIVTHEDQILDGRNRWRVCEALGIKPDTVEWDGEAGHPIMFVVAKNIHRRHLTPSQRGIIIARHVLPALEIEAAERKGGRPTKAGPKAAPVSDKGKAAEQEHRLVRAVPSGSSAIPICAGQRSSVWRAVQEQGLGV